MLPTSVGRRGLVLLAAVVGAMFSLQPTAAQQAPTMPSETPAQFTPVTDAFDYERRDVMIPMRDGVKLHTVILVPRAPRARRSCSRARPTTRRR